MDHVQDRAEEEFKGEVVYVTTLPRHIMGSHVLEQRYRQKPAILMVVQVMYLLFTCISNPKNNLLPKSFILI